MKWLMLYLMFKSEVLFRIIGIPALIGLVAGYSFGDSGYCSVWVCAIACVASWIAGGAMSEGLASTIREWEEVLRKAEKGRLR